MQYFGYLRRDPDDAPEGNFDGHDFWPGKLNQAGGNFVQAEMVKASDSRSGYLGSSPCLPVQLTQQHTGGSILEPPVLLRL